MLAEVVFHLTLEGIGAGIVACIKGTCTHEHKVLNRIKWPLIAGLMIAMSALTVILVG